MEDMTNEQIKEMVGTEYLYVFLDHSEVPAVVAAFDPEIGLTCLATDIETSTGEDILWMKDENGNICLTGYTAVQIQQARKSLSRTLRSIKILGYYKAFSSKGFGSSGGGGSATCSF